MALNYLALSLLIQQYLTEAGFSLSPSDWTKLFCDAIAKAVVEHITSAAEVTTPMGAGTIS
jgi:hypothetical protein